MCDENSLCARYYLLPKGSVKSLKHSTFETKTEDVSLSGERLSGASSEFELIKRVESLESKLMPIGVTPGPKMSASVATVFRDVAKSGCYSSMFKRVPSEYYLWDLSRRAKELGCGCRTNQLTKSMLMEVRGWGRGEEGGRDKERGRGETIVVGRIVVCVDNNTTPPPPFPPYPLPHPTPPSERQTHR